MNVRMRNTIATELLIPVTTLSIFFFSSNLSSLCINSRSVYAGLEEEFEEFREYSCWIRYGAFQGILVGPFAVGGLFLIAGRRIIFDCR
jgi:hypothetical protein